MSNLHLDTRYKRFINHFELYERIPMKCETVLPDEGFEMREVVLTAHGDSFKVYCLAKDNPERKSRISHRVFVVCACGKDIPFGRMGQHFNARPCREKRKELFEASRERFIDKFGTD